MDKKTILQTVTVLIVAMVIAFIIRGLLLQAKQSDATQMKEEESSYHEEIVKPYKGIIVVIDAGHGGEDPGKVGVDGTLEKDINLKIALSLKEALEAEGMTVVLTRDSDKGLYDSNSQNKKIEDMKERLAIMEESKADLVVSIHQNSFRSSAVSGPQVFYYESSIKGEQAAEYIQNSMNKELQISRPRVQKGNDNYYLLKRCSKTTVIVECGFLSNPDEEKLLREAEYQSRIVEAVKKGICLYFEAMAEETVI